eukprot:3959454-Lingulodinium_polyedra.AAC.1
MKSCLLKRVAWWSASSWLARPGEHNTCTSSFNIVVVKGDMRARLERKRLPLAKADALWKAPQSACKAWMHWSFHLGSSEASRANLPGHPSVCQDMLATRCLRTWTTKERAWSAKQSSWSTRGSVGFMALGVEE